VRFQEILKVLTFISDYKSCKIKKLMLLFVIFSFLTSITSCQEIIENGKIECSDGWCRVDCDYGFIPRGSYVISETDLIENLAVCETPLGIVAGGYNKDWNNDEVYLSSTELYSMSSEKHCNFSLPALPVNRKGMFGGWVNGIVVVCGGVDMEGVIGADCFQYNRLDNVWVYLQTMQIERSYAAADIVEGCLLVTGGKTNEGPTDTTEIIGGESCNWEHGEIQLLKPREGHCMVTLGEDIVIVGGGPDNYGSTQIYNLATGEWRNGSDPQKDRALHGCAPLETEDGYQAMVVAGNDFSPQDLAEIYFPHNDTWVWTKNWMKTERSGVAMTVLGGRPTVLGGYGGDYCCKEFYLTAESWDNESEHWWTLHSRNLTEGRKSLAVMQIPSSLFSGCT